MSILECARFSNSYRTLLRPVRQRKSILVASILVLCADGLLMAADLVGTMPGQFSVSDRGAAQYTVPIDAPAATGGMQPGIALTYNHRGGNGIAGQGWTVGGLSEITRCVHTIVQDGSGRGIHYTLEDRFCLDGQKLMLTSGTYGASASEYRTEIDDFRKIVASGVHGNGPQSFIVTERNGTRHFYGHVNNSSLTGLVNTYSNWARYGINDTFANNIDFFYNVPTSPGELTLNRIEYTRNVGLSARYKVKFEYLDRPDSDKRSGFNFGVIWSKDKRLSKITVQNLSVAGVWETIHDYTLDYAPESTVVTGRSQLISVQQCRGTTCLPKTTFDWQNAVVGWESAASSGQSSSGHTSTKLGDFNNDGQQDLYVTDNGEWHILRASGGTFLSALDTNKVATAGSRPMDFNGDGKTDLLFVGGDSKFHVYQATTTGFTEITTTATHTSGNFWITQDADGDGRDDLIYKSGNEVYLRKSTGTDFESTPKLMMDTPASNFGFRHRSSTGPDNQLDFDGDGRGDILLRETTTTGGRRGGGTTTVEWLAYRYVDLGYVFYGELDDDVSRKFADINGDGLDDVAYYSGGSWQHALSNGLAFDAAVSSAISDSYPGKAIFADYDGDGRDDLIRATSTDWVVHKSNGDGFESNGVLVGGPDPLNSQAFPMDISGSGYDELVMSYANLWQIRDHKSPAADVLTKVTDGLGNVSEPSYSSLAGMADYLGTASGTFPMRRFSKPYYVVDAYSANDGIGGTYSIDYQYWDAMIHTEGYDFLGFDATEATDSRDGAYRRTEFAQEVPYFGVVDDTYIKQSDGTIISQNDPSLTNTPIGTFPSLRYFVRAETRTIETFEIGGILKGQQITKVVQDPTFETTYGNVTSNVITTTSAQAVGDTYTTTIDYQYANYTTPWCLGLPTQVIITRSAPGATTDSRTIDNTFDSSDCQLLTTTDVSELDTNLQLEITLTHDLYGNVKTVTQDSVNGGDDDRKMEFVYDSWGHLPESRKDYVDILTDPELSWTWDYKLTQPLTRTDPQGQVVEWDYDEFGRLTAQTRPDGTTVTFTYSECISPCEFTRSEFFVEMVESSGFKARQYRDSFGRLVGGWNYLPTGTKSKVQFDFDDSGFVDKRYIPWIDGESSFSIDLDYDLIGRVVVEDRPIDENTISGAVTTTKYQGLTRTVTNAEGQATTYNLDPLGRVEKVTDDLGGETVYEYTVFDRLHKLWDPAGVLTTINYNDRGDTISMVEPDLGSWSYGHNVFGELTSQTDAKSQLVTFGYNQLGLLTSRVEGAGTTTWNYFTTADYKLWLPSSVSSPGFSESYSYDTLSRPSSVTTTIDSVNYATDLSYHSAGSGKGKLHRITYPESTLGVRLKVDYEYDSWGLIEKIKNGDTPTTVYYQLSETDAFGRERLATFGNGLDEDRDYDDANGFLKTIKTGPNLTATIQNLSYEWDKVGNLKERDDVNQSKSEVFTYDGLSRIKTVALNGISTLTVNYEGTGNISFKSDVGTYSYALNSNRVTSITGTRPGTYAYDLNGNMTDRDGDVITWKSYNKPDRIDYGTDYAQFDYGPNRARIKQVAKTGINTVTSYYIGRHFQKESDGSTTKYRHHIFAGDATVAIHTRPSSGSVTTRYIHRDHQNNVSALTDENGNVSEEYSFDAFGKRRNTDWSADNGDLRFSDSHLTERGYTGHEHLDNVLLIHMNGRVQDPIIGRMISADPFVPNTFDSQSFNRYSYVVNRPLSLVDPSGFDHDDVRPRTGQEVDPFCTTGVNCGPGEPRVGNHNSKDVPDSNLSDQELVDWVVDHNEELGIEMAEGVKVIAVPVHKVIMLNNIVIVSEPGEQPVTGNFNKEENIIEIFKGGLTGGFVTRQTGTQAQSEAVEGVMETVRISGQALTRAESVVLTVGHESAHSMGIDVEEGTGLDNHPNAEQKGYDALGNYRRIYGGEQ